MDADIRAAGQCSVDLARREDASGKEAKGGGGGDSASSATTTGTTTTTGVDHTGTTSGTFLDDLSTAVAQGNIQEVQAKFTTDSWNQTYKSYFESSDTDLSKLSEELGGATLDQEEDDYAVYKITREEDGTTKVYYLQLIKSENEWKVLSM